MDDRLATPAPPKPPKTPFAGFWGSRAWLVLLAALTLGHGWIALGFFDADSTRRDAWAALADDQPLISGRHAIHLYHGWLGGRGFYERRDTLVFDPNFSAGYPKTTWFDAGSKPAEAAFAITGGRFAPGTYKVSLFLGWCFLPLILAGAARAAGASRGAACITAFLAVAVLAGEVGRQRMFEGDLDLMLGAALACLALGLLVAYHHASAGRGALALVGFAVTGWLCVWIQPFLALAMMPALLLYYLGTGWQHRVPWSVGLAAALAFVVGGNWPWLRDAGRFWWVLAEPNASVTGTLSVAELYSQLQSLSPLGINPLQQGFGLVLLAMSVFGVGAMAITHRGPAARTFGTAVVALLALGLLGGLTDLLQRFEPARLVGPGLLAATVLAGHALGSFCQLLARWAGSPVRGAAMTAALLLAGAGLFRDPLLDLAGQCLRSDPLPRGLPAGVSDTLRTVEQRTTRDARILWEETPETDAWTPLLAVYTDRIHVGGLGSHSALEPTCAKLVSGWLAGRRIEEWQKTEFEDYCRRFNISWVVCRSAAATDWMRSTYGESAGRELPDGSLIFTLDRMPSYVLSGNAVVAAIDHRAIVLESVQPNKEGYLVLSLHHLPSMLPSSERVWIEREPQPHDAVPFVRLQVPGDMSRLTIYWSD